MVGFLRVFSVVLLLSAGPYAFASRCVKTVESSRPTILSYSLKSGQMISELEAARTTLFEKIESIEALPAKEQTFESIVEATDKAFAGFLGVYYRYAEVGAIHQSSAVREEASRFMDRVYEIFGEVNTRNELWKRVAAAKPNHPEQATLRKTLLKNAGLRDEGNKKTSKKKVLEASEIMTRSSSQLQRYLEGLNGDGKRLTLTKVELKGVEESVLAPFESGKGTYEIPANNPGLFEQLMSQVDSAATRRKIYTSFRSRNPEGVGLLEQGLWGLNKAAQLSGYKSALGEVIGPETLGGSPAKVEAFLDRLLGAYKEKTGPLLEQMQELKRQDLGRRTRLQMWDIHYYGRKLAERSTQGNPIQFPSEHFPVERTLTNILELVGDLYGIQFLKVSEPSQWADSVTSYHAYRRGSKELIGELHLDLYSRESKGAGSFITPLQYGIKGENGELLQRPVVGLMANLGKQNGDLKLHESQITMLMHELGHVVHALLASHKYFTTNGFNAERDFIEVPSTLLELLAQRPEVLSQLSKDQQGQATWSVADAAAYRNYRQSLIEHSYIKPAPFQSRTYQHNLVFLSVLDFRINEYLAKTPKEEVDLRRVYAEEHLRFYGMLPPKGDHFLNTFMHGAAGYNGAMYSYIWANMVAANLVSRIEALGGIQSPGAQAFVEGFRTQLLEVPVGTDLSTRLNDLLEGPIKIEPVLKSLSLN